MSPGYGAEREELRSKGGGKRLKRLTVHMPEDRVNGDYKVEHENFPPHGPERFQFGAAEKAGLAEHLAKHVGLKLPGKAAGGGSAEPEVSKSDFE